MDLSCHEPMQRALRAARVTRRIDEHGLIGAAIQHAEHALARRVRLVRDDAELLADERVQQRRFADVRPADDRDEAAAAACLCQCSLTGQHQEHRRGGFLFRSAAALSMTGRMGIFSRTSHSTVNVCSWSRPCTAVTAYDGKGSPCLATTPAAASSGL